MYIRSREHTITCLDSMMPSEATWRSSTKHLPATWRRRVITWNRSSSVRKMFSSKLFFLDVTKLESSLHVGKLTHVSLSTCSRHIETCDESLGPIATRTATCTVSGSSHHGAIRWRRQWWYGDEFLMATSVKSRVSEELRMMVMTLDESAPGFFACLQTTVPCLVDAHTITWLTNVTTAV